MPAPARVVIPAERGDDRLEGVTVAEPPAAVSGFFAASPMTAIDRTLPARQRQRAVLVLEQDDALRSAIRSTALVRRGADVRCP